MADQQAAVFGQCCFDVGDVNCTLGTGSFINVNTGSYPHASVAGMISMLECLTLASLSFMFKNYIIHRVRHENRERVILLSY